MKITFLIPPCYDHSQPAERSAGCTRIVYPMINIYELTLAAFLRERLPATVDYQDFVFHSRRRREFEPFVANDNSDAYFIWTVNLSLESDLQAISIIRQSHPTTPVILTGPGVTFYTDKALVDPNVFVVRGEPEESALELLEALRDGKPLADIRGISYINKEGKKVNNPPRPLSTDLDSFPFPARDLLKDQVYHNPKLKMGPYTTMLTSRNCPFKCIYCVPSSLTFAREIEYGREHGGRKPTIGFRSVESVEKEVAMLAAQGYKAIGFMDDNFIWNEERTRAICDTMRRHKIRWGCQARVDAITPAIAKMLSESYCGYVDLGVESFDEEILKYVKKGITPDDIRRAIGLLKEYGVPVKLNILIGCSPLESRETVMHTLREVKKLDVDQVMFNIVSPFPGTKYYDLCKENGWLKDDEYRPTDVQHESILNLPNLTAKEMEHLLFVNNLRYYLSPRFIAKQLTRFKSPTEFIAALKALKLKLFH
ncbi:MAG: B12-binding domain-containing radical SAM protein [Muribaculaceae bacterium]|nr:B12-binding domain-containing radical SAM protein [Muribaculaceae bacterium]